MRISPGQGVGRTRGTNILHDHPYMDELLQRLESDHCKDRERQPARPFEELAPRPSDGRFEIFKAASTQSDVDDWRSMHQGVSYLTIDAADDRIETLVPGSHSQKIVQV